MNACPEELPREFLDSVAALVERYSGIASDGVYLAALRRGVVGRMRALQCTNLLSYLFLLQQRGSEELQRLTEALVNTETSFFRNRVHFRVLRDFVLPPLAQQGRPVYLWSVGCATGEEAYSLAITCLEAGLGTPNAPAKVLATDISRSALRTAAQGEYPDKKLATVPVHLRPRYFEPHGKCWRVRPQVRALVTVAYHNLVDPGIPVAPGSVDVIFCQNVTIYFRSQTARAIVVRLASALREGGYLFPGFSEMTWHPIPNLSLVFFEHSFAYRKNCLAETERAENIPQRRSATAERRHAPAFERSSNLLPQRLQDERSPVLPGDREDALTRALNAVRQDPLSEAGWERLALVYRQAGRFSEAEQALRRLIYLNPESPLAYFHLAALFQEAGQPREARRQYANAAKLLSAMSPETVVGGIRADLILKACRQAESRLQNNI